MQADALLTSSRAAVAATTAGLAGGGCATERSMDYLTLGTKASELVFTSRRKN